MTLGTNGDLRDRPGTVTESSLGGLVWGSVTLWEAELNMRGNRLRIVETAFQISWRAIFTPRLPAQHRRKTVFQKIGQVVGRNLDQDVG